MTTMSDLCRIRFPTKNFFKFSPYCVLPCHSQIMEHAVTGVLFLEFLDLHFHLDPVLDSVYIVGSCCFHFYSSYAETLLSHSLTHCLILPHPTSLFRYIWHTPFHFQLQQLQLYHWHHHPSRSPLFPSMTTMTRQRLRAHLLHPLHQAVVMPRQTLA